MFKKVYGVILSGALMAVSSLANSATVNDVATALGEARANLLQMLSSTDKAANEALKAKIEAASKNVDTAVGELLADKAMTPDKIEQLKTFKTNWEDFKKTREGEIIPAIFSGKVEVAKDLAKGVQAERMKKMKAALTSLGWKDPDAK
jgi:hypothetical protein